MVMSMVVWVVTSFIIEIEYPVILTVGVCALSYFISIPFTKNVMSEVPG
jgi:hypothetical protein